jgi:NAD(P)H dehydrogenase (quinone)
MLLVTGANGNLGRAVIANLKRLAPGRFAVGTRTPDTPFARALAAEGIEVRTADFDRPQTLPGAFEDVDKALIISTYAPNSERLGQNLRAVEAAKAAGVSHLIYTSFVNAGGPSQANHNIEVHGPTERAIMASGLTWTLLRHALYADVMTGDLDEVLATGVMAQAIGAAPCAFVARADLGVSAATVLASEGHQNRTYTETMERTYSGQDIAGLISEVFGRKVEFHAVSAEEWPAFMGRKFGVPEHIAKSSIGTMRAVAAGEFDVATADYETITGRKARSFEQFLRDLKAERDKAA